MDDDFEQAAKPLIEKLGDTMDPDNARDFVVGTMRAIWNARGAADLAVVDDIAHTNDAAIVAAIRGLDR